MYNLFPPALDPELQAPRLSKAEYKAYVQATVAGRLRLGAFMANGLDKMVRVSFYHGAVINEARILLGQDQQFDPSRHRRDLSSFLLWLSK